MLWMPERFIPTIRPEDTERSFLLSGGEGMHPCFIPTIRPEDTESVSSEHQRRGPDKVSSPRSGQRILKAFIIFSLSRSSTSVSSPRSGQRILKEMHRRSLPAPYRRVSSPRSGQRILKAQKSNRGYLPIPTVSSPRSGQRILKVRLMLSSSVKSGMFHPHDPARGY